MDFYFANNATVKNSDIYNASTDNLYVYAGSYITMDTMKTYNAGSNGIDMNNSTYYSTINNIQSFDNGLDGIYTYN